MSSLTGWVIGPVGTALVSGREPAPEPLQQAEREGVPVLGTRLSAFELAGRLYGLGVKGS